MLSAFGLPTPAGSEAGTAAAALQDYGAFIAGGGNSGTSGWPKGWLNMLIFDKDYNLVDLAYEQLDGAYVQPVGNVNKLPMQLLSLTKTIKEPGYVYIYVSNEGSVQQDIYFDDLTITHEKSRVVQAEDYYPFGLTFNLYQRENTTRQDYKYNGKEEQKELDLDWLDYGMRMYQPDIGRFATIDRFTEEYLSLSQYGYAANNSLKYIDHNGDSLIVVTLTGLNSEDAVLRERQFLVDSEISENLVGFAKAAMERFSTLSVNNVFRAKPSSSIKTSNTKATGLSRHQAGFAVDFNGVRTLNDDELAELNGIAADFGFSPLSNQAADPPHFSINPTSHGYQDLASAVEENKGHFDQIVNSEREGGVRTSILKNKKGEVIGVRFERGNNTSEDQTEFNKLVDELITNSK